MVNSSVKNVTADYIVIIIILIIVIIIHLLSFVVKYLQNSSFILQEKVNSYLH